MTTIYKFVCGYTKAGVATSPSSAPTITIVDSGNNILASAQATTARTNIAGVYDYSYSGADSLDLIGLFHTSDTTVDRQDLHSHPYDAVILASIATRLAPTIAGRTLDVSATGEAGVDWANVGSPTTVVGLSGTTVGTATNLTNSSAPTVAEIDAQLSGTHGAGTWGGAVGSGAITHIITINDGVNPIDGVDVWISTDLAGTSVVARGTTSALGIVTFYLDAGTYYAWKQLAGYDFTNPQSFTVS